MRHVSTIVLLCGLAACASGGAVVDGVKEDEPGLFAQATVNPDSARQVALAQLPGGTVHEAELENEDGRLIYSFEIKVTGQKGKTEVHVDARTGQVVKVEK